MKLQGFTPVLYCQDIDTCLAFYRDALNFVVLRERREQGMLQWVHLKSGDAMMMLESVPSAMPLGDKDKDEKADILLYFYCDDAETNHHFVVARGFDAGDIETTDWHMKEFSLLDPEGRRLKIGERLHTTDRRGL